MREETERKFRAAHNINGAISLMGLGTALGGVALSTNPVTAPLALPVLLGGMASTAVAGHFAQQNLAVARSEMDGDNVAEAMAFGCSPSKTPNIANLAVNSACTSIAG